MKKSTIVFLTSMCLAALAGCGNSKVEKADMVVFGNQIYTANEKGEFAEAFAVKDGKYIFVGDSNKAEKYIGKGTSVYNFNFVMPSAIEAHAHFILEQAFMETCYIVPKKENGEFKVKKEMVDQIAEYALENCWLIDDTDHLFGYGYDQTYFILSGEKYGREDLDGICDGIYASIPIYIAESSLHEAWVNTTTLTRAGIKITLEDGEQDPVVGINRDDNGVATGVIINEAVAYVLQKGFRYPILEELAYQRVIKNTSQYLNQMGYTGHYDAWSNFDGTNSIYEALYKVDQAKQLTCFFATSYNIATFEYKSSSLETILDKIVDIRNQYKSAHSDTKFVKLFADGVLETGTGFIKEPYTFDPNSYGEQIWQQNDMNKIVLEANKKDLLVHTHTLGDASFSETVQAYINANNVLGRKIRNSLGHCILIDEADYPLVKENEIGIAINAGWLAPDVDGLDLYRLVIGEERAKKLYPSDGLLNFGINPAICTDRPCAAGPIDVFDFLASIILGYDANYGNQVSRREVNIDVKDAINMLTINGAWMANYEDERGSIEVGKYADFIVSDYSPFNVAPRVIKDINVELTCFEGKFVYIKNK